MVGMSALAAKEVILRTSVSFFSMSTGSAALGCVASVNFGVLHPIQCRFVLDKLTKLVEAPIATFSPGFAPNPGPQVDARQIFEGDALLRA